MKKVLSILNSWTAFAAVLICFIFVVAARVAPKTETTPEKTELTNEQKLQKRKETCVKIAASIKDPNIAKAIREVGPLAVEFKGKDNIPAAITMAQYILESDAGTSVLAVKANNHFGRKCFSRRCKKGHCMNRTDDSHKDFFVIFKTRWDSFKDRSNFITKGDRYKVLFSEKPTKKPGYVKGSVADACWIQAINNWDSPTTRWAYGLRALGYATAKDYSEHLLSLIKENNLQLLDKL